MSLRSPLLVLAALALAVLVPSTADADRRIDGIEHIFGATNVGAITGHGRMSVAVSPDGDVSVLSWPSPSVADQLAYASSNAVDARDMPRLGAPEGAGVFLGLLVEHDDSSRELTWLRDRSTWEITQDYGPSDGPNPTTVHTSASLGLTVTVVDAVAPPPSDGSSWHDVFVRDVTVERDAGSTVASAWLVTYGNLSPQPPNAKIPQLPVADWVYDGRNDFAAVWDDEAGAVLHFHPNDQRVYDALSDLLEPPEVAFGPVGELLKDASPAEADVASLAAGLDAEYAEGSYLALTTSPAPDQHQVGFDETPFCALAEELADNILELPERFPTLSLPIAPEVVEVLKCDPSLPTFRDREGWMHTAEDAFADAADGELSGSSVAAGEVNEALRTPLSFSGDVASAQVVLGAAATADGARAALDSVADPSAVPAASEAALDDWLAGRRIPEDAPAEVVQVARRSLINLRVGTDDATGAVVASIARQPPYGVDWPRDGAFFNVAQDVSGQHELVARRNRLYAEWQRKEPERPTPFTDPEGGMAPPKPDGSRSAFYPAGAWEMNYYPDGTTGGVFRFEIDNAGFAVWMMVAHVGWVPEAERESYLRSVWDAVVLGADFLAEWRDPDNGLQAPAEEDDNPGYVQTLHGAVTTYGALEMASRGARLLGETEAAERWEQRAGELRDSMLFYLYDEEAERFVGKPGESFTGSWPKGPAAWLVWPMTLLPLDDPRVQTQITANLEAIRPAVNLEEDGQYFMKSTVSAGVAQLGLSGADRDALAGELDTMLPKIAAQSTDGTHHYGEAMAAVEEGGERRASQRVANPHLWEGTLFYLSAMAAEDPGALMAYEDALPPSQVPEPGTVGPVMPGEDGGVGDGGTGDAGADAGTGGGGDGCGCRVMPASSRGPMAILLVGVLVVGLVLWRRGRRGR